MSSAPDHRFCFEFTSALEFLNEHSGVVRINSECEFTLVLYANPITDSVDSTELIAQSSLEATRGTPDGTTVPSL